ncbi:Serine aminopeptidase, S33 [Sphingobium sp. AP50]|uniref:alpha/beta hydrolase n=1 Tax=Sphingobium sp. AP50 TaxID=1884369 RepID=UPI0008B6A770|nr:alpha/beta fold hydrolase [Sphingobium sp. AP50]SEJ97094.1 Serine aminopeptidase, S33 [Sphingobium sp. AP50]
MNRINKVVSIAIGLFLSACSAPKEDSDPAGNVAQMEMTAAAQTAIIGTEDGKKVFLDHVPVESARATIILLHQAGASGYEFKDIVPRLNAEGYSTVLVDLRSGGSLYGPNRTVNKYGKSAQNFSDALPDIEAALNWARLQGPPVILLGSSYSASLCLRVAADNPSRVAAVLAFSPGEYFPDRHFTGAAAKAVTVPVYISQSSETEEILQSKSIFDALASKQKILFVARNGSVHGASTLRSDRNPSGADENWKSMNKFLTTLSLR